MAKKPAPRRRKREALVHQHLENVSRDLLERHPDVVQQFIGRNTGDLCALSKEQTILRGTCYSSSWSFASPRQEPTWQLVGQVFDLSYNQGPTSS